MAGTMTDRERIERRMTGVLMDSVIPWWFATPLRQLDGLTPAQAIEAGKIAEVDAVVDAYFDPSFG